MPNHGKDMNPAAVLRHGERAVPGNRPEKADVLDEPHRAAPPGRARRAHGAALMRPAVTDALTVALFAEWAERGCGALSLEAVARRASVGKAAPYRRWPSKLAMVADRFEVAGKAIPHPSGIGNLHDDVRALLGHFLRLLRHPLVRRIVPDLQGEMQRSPELAAFVRERFVTERRRHCEKLLQRAVERGELHPRVDVELADDANR